MARNQDAHFISSSLKVTQCPLSPPLLFAPQNLCFHLDRSKGACAHHLPFARQNLSFHLRRAGDSILRFVTSIPFSGGVISSLSSSFLRPLLSTPAARAEPELAGNYPRRHGKEAEERVLISEVLIRNKDGEELERADLAAEAAAALKSCRPNSALTLSEVQEDVHRIIQSGYFFSCVPVAVDTRDGIRLVFQVEPNQEFQGLVCEGASALPSKFLEDAFRDGYVMQEKLSMYDI